MPQDNKSGNQPSTEGTSGQQQGATGNQQQPGNQVANPWDGIEIDDLPDGVREKIVAAKTEFEKTQTEKTNLEKRLTDTTEFGRQQQSRADKAQSVLQRHNLSDGGTPVTPTNPADAAHQAMVAQFVKDGLKPDVAEGYAKMFGTSNAIQREQILREISPLVGNVAGMQASTLLSAAKSSHGNIFAVPEVAQQIESNVQVLLQQGTPVDKATVDHLVAMAWGNHLIRNPQTPTQPSMNQQLPQFSSSQMSNGGHLNSTQRQQGGAPNASQPETVTMMNAVRAEFQRGLPSKKGGK